MPPEILVANDHFPVEHYVPRNPHGFGWVVPTKPIPVAFRKEQLPQSNNDVLAELYERTDRDIQKYRWEDQEDFKNIEKRMGKSLEANELIRRILKLNNALLYEDSKWSPGCGAFYLVLNGSKIYTNACFRKGIVPEFTYLITDRADLPTRDGLHYGWRTVLQRLVQCKAITYRQAVNTFGEVHYGDVRGKHWNRNISKFKH